MRYKSSLWPPVDVASDENAVNAISSILGEACPAKMLLTQFLATSVRMLGEACPVKIINYIFNLLTRKVH